MPVGRQRRARTRAGSAEGLYHPGGCEEALRNKWWPSLRKCVHRKKRTTFRRSFCRGRMHESVKSDAKGRAPLEARKRRVEMRACTSFANRQQTASRQLAAASAQPPKPSVQPEVSVDEAAARVGSSAGSGGKRKRGGEGPVDQEGGGAPGPERSVEEATGEPVSEGEVDGAVARVGSSASGSSGNAEVAQGVAPRGKKRQAGEAEGRVRKRQGIEADMEAQPVEEASRSRELRHEVSSLDSKGYALQQMEDSLL